MMLHGIPQHGVIPEIDERAYLGRYLADGLPDVVDIVISSEDILVQLADLLVKSHS